MSFLFAIAFSFNYLSEIYFTSLGIIISISLLIGYTLKKINLELTGKFILLLVVSFCLGVVIARYRVENLKVETLPKPIISNVTGEVSAMKPTSKGMQVTLEKVFVKKISTNFPKIRISVPFKYLPDLSIGSKVEVLAKLFDQQNNLFINNSKIEVFTYFGGISATGYAMSRVNILGEVEGDSSKGRIHKIRMKILIRLIEILGKEKGNFAAAILIGETKGIDKKITTDMRQSGISHILCVSGLHLTLVAMIIFVSTRVLLNLSNYIAYNYNIKIMAAIFSLLGSYAYLEISGMQIAATRAFIMTAIFIIAIIAGRSCFPMRSLGVAAVIILIFNPEYVFHPSFQLSFIAVISLIAGFEFYLKNPAIIGKSKGIFASLKLYFISNIYSSFLSSIITAPVVINQFYIFSTYSVLANLIAVPIMSFFLMQLLLLSMLLMPIGFDKYFLKLAGFFIQIIIDTASYINSLPLAVWYFGHITSFSLILFLLGFFWLVIWNTTWRVFGAFVILISFILMLFTHNPDVIISGPQQAVITYNQQSPPVIITEKISELSRINIANWFGYKEAIVKPLQDEVFTTKDGARILINYSGTLCEEGKILININKPKDCPNAKQIINLMEVEGRLFVYCSKKSCKIKK